jgi:MFS family permease
MGHSHRNLRLVSLAGFLFYFGNSQLVLLPIFLDERGVRVAEIGVLMAAMPLTAMLLRLFTGQLVASFGGRPIIVICALIYGALLPVYLLVTPANLGLFVFLRVLQGIGSAGMDTGLNMVAADSQSREERAGAIGRATVFFILGWTLSTPVAELLYRNFGFPPVFVVGSAFCLVAGAIALRLAPARRESYPFRMSLLTYGRRLLGRDMRLLLAAGVLVAMVGGSLTTFIPLYAASRQVGAGSLFFLAFAVGSVLVLVLLGGHSDRVGRRRMIIPAVLIAMGAPLALVNLRAAWMVGLSGLIFGLADGTYSPALMALPLDLNDQRSGAVAMALVFMAFDAGGMVGTSLFGVLSARVGFGAAFAGAALLYPLAALLVAAIKEVPRLAPVVKTP